VPRTIEGYLEMRKREMGQGPQSVTTVSLLPPGRHRVWIRGTYERAMHSREAVEVAFTDRDGVHWIRRATGLLEELPEAPLDYFKQYELYTPHELQTPEPLH
jgi:hypothetical protein